MLYAIVVGEQEQALAVNIEPSHGVHIAGERTELDEAPMAMFRRELRQDAVRLEHHNVSVR